MQASLVTPRTQTQRSSIAAVQVTDLSHTYPKVRKAGRRGNKTAASRDEQPGGDQAVDGTPRPALAGVSLDVEPGEIFCVLGPNGGGKTTLFRILSTLLRPSSGQASIFGNDVVSQSHAVREQLGVAFQSPSLDVKLTARENLLHHGHLYGLRGAGLRQRIDRLLDQVHLGQRAGEYVETFSGGMRRRVELAKALLHEPKLLLLDEPSTGLDPAARRDLWDVLERLCKEQGVTIVFTTHILEEADRCDHVAILSQGKLVAVDSPGTLKAMIGGDVLTIEPATDPQALCDAITERLGPWADDAAPKVVDGAVRFEKPDGAQVVAEVAASVSGSIRRITVSEPTLEDVFMHLTGRGLEDSSQL